MLFRSADENSVLLIFEVLGIIINGKYDVLIARLLPATINV